MTKPMRRLTTDDYAVDAVTMAKALVGAWLCRRLDDGAVVRRRITETEAYCGEEPHWHRLRLQARPKPQVAIYAKQGQYMNKVRSDLDERTNPDSAEVCPGLA